jgi:hypothetical protein
VSDVATALPDVDVKDGSTVTVALDDAAALVTGLVVHGVTAEGEPVDLELDVVPPYVYAEPT